MAVLVSADWVEERLERPGFLVIDTRSAMRYLMGHLKSAVSVPQRKLLDLQGRLLPVEDLARLFGEAGIGDRETPVLYDGHDGRKAMQAAVNREAIVQAATLGQGVVGYDHPLAPTDPRFTPQYAPPAYDPELAKSLLEQAGYPNGIDITLHTADVAPGHVEMALAFKESAAAAGIRVDVQRGPAEGYWLDKWFVEPLSTISWTPRGVDSVMSEVYDSASTMNVEQYFNPVLDDLIVKARGQDLEGQKETYAEIQRILVDDVPIIITAFQPSLLGVRNHVRGVVAHPLGIMIVRDAWLDD